MNKLVVLAALAFALGTVHQASACDFGMHAANAAPVVVACSGNNCGTDATATRQPAAKPEPAAPTVATDKPMAPPVTVADGS
jgi:hypothetical protein